MGKGWCVMMVMGEIEALTNGERRWEEGCGVVVGRLLQETFKEMRE